MFRRHRDFRAVRDLQDRQINFQDRRHKESLGQQHRHSFRVVWGRIQIAEVFRVGPDSVLV